MNDKEDLLKRAYVTLSALKQNLATKGSIGEEDVVEYRAVLDRMKGLGLDVEEFLIPSDKVRPVVTSGHYLTGEVTYSEKKYDKTYLMFKLDSLLGYFSLTYDEHKPTIGFAQV